MDLLKDSKNRQKSKLLQINNHRLFVIILFFIFFISNTTILSAIQNVEENRVIQLTNDGNDFFFLTKTEGFKYYTPQSDFPSASYSFSFTPIKDLTSKILKISNNYFFTCLNDALFLLIDSSRNTLFKYGSSEDIKVTNFCYSQFYSGTTILSYIIKPNKHLIYSYDYKLNKMILKNEEYSITESSTNLLNNFNKPDSCIIMENVILCSYRLTSTKKIQFYILDLTQKKIKEVNMGFNERSTNIEITKLYIYSYEETNFLFAKYNSLKIFDLDKYKYDINTNTISENSFGRNIIEKSRIDTINCFDVIFMYNNVFILARNYEKNIEIVQYSFSSGSQIEKYEKSKNCNDHYFIQLSEISGILAAVTACKKNKDNSIIYEIHYVTFLKCVSKTFTTDDFDDSGSIVIDIENDNTYNGMKDCEFHFVSVPSDGITMVGYYKIISTRSEEITTSSEREYKKFIIKKQNSFTQGQRKIEYTISKSSSLDSDLCYFIVNFCCEECETCFNECDKRNGNQYCTTCKENYYSLEDDNTVCITKDTILDYYYFDENDKIFKKCKKSCKTCQSYEDCLTCDNNYQESDIFHNDVDGTKCVPNCPISKAWVQNVENNIIKCLDRKEDCKNLYNQYLTEDSNNNFQCVSKCEYGDLIYIYDNEKCVESCAENNKYFVSSSSNNKTNNILCLDECKDDYPYYGDNFECLSKCQEFYVESSNTCTDSCLEYNLYSYIGENKVCVENCPLYYLVDNKECVDSCINFNKYYVPIPYNLTKYNPCLDSCSNLLFPYYGDNNQCLQLCPYYYLQNNKKCVNSCFTYKKYYIKIPQNLTNDNPCMDSCPSDFPFYGDNYQCLKECPNYYLPNKTCVNSCNYYNENTLIKECINTCSTTSEGYYIYGSNTNKICYKLSCPTEYPYLTLPNICSDTCVSQNFIDINTNICQSSCDSLDSDTCKNVCSFNSTYLLTDSGNCVDQCDPLVYTANHDYFYCNSFYDLYNATTKEEVIDIVKNRIKAAYVYDSELNTTKFLISVSDSDESDEEIEKILNSDYAYVDLGECETLLRKENNIPEEEPLIILVIEEINNTKMCYDLNFTVYSLDQKKLNLSVCDGISFNISTPIRNTSGINLEEAEEFASKNIDVFNRNDSFFNELCYKYTSNDKTDVILSDRVSNYYQENTFCSDAGNCTYLNVDYEHKRVNCECEADTVVNEEEDIKVDLNDVVKELNVNKFLKVFKNSTINVVICYNLVFSKEFFTDGNYGGYFFIFLIVLQIVLFIIYIVGKMKPIKNTINEVVFEKKNNLYNVLQKIKNNKKENIETHKNLLTNDLESHNNLVINKKSSRKAARNNIVFGDRDEELMKKVIARKKVTFANPPKNQNDEENNNDIENIEDNYFEMRSNFQRKRTKSQTIKKNKKVKFEILTNIENLNSNNDNEQVVVQFNNKKYKITSNSGKTPKRKFTSTNLNKMSIDNDQNIFETKSLYDYSPKNYKDKASMTHYNTNHFRRLNITQNFPVIKSPDDVIFAENIGAELIRKRLNRINNKKNEQKDTAITETEIIQVHNIRKDTKDTIDTKDNKNIIIIKNDKYDENNEDNKDTKDIKNNTDVINYNDYDDEYCKSKDKLENKKEKKQKVKRKVKEHKNLKRLLKYENYLTNYLDYNEALQFDKRSFSKMYKDTLLLSHNLLYTFFFNDKLNLKTVTLSLFFFSLSLDLVLNCLFYDDEDISHTFYIKGDFDFLFNLPQTIYSSIINLVLSFITQILTSIKNKLLFIIFELEEKTKAKIDKMYKRMRIKVKIYFIIVIIISAIFWYYIAAFCAVYPNSQKQFFIDTVISFVFEIITPFGFALLITYIKYHALQKKSKCLYKIADLLL